MSSGHLPTPRCWNCRPDPSGRRLLTISEAAPNCGVSINAVYQWMERGLIDWVLTPGGMRRIFADTLTRLQRRRLDRSGQTQSRLPLSRPDLADLERSRR